MDNNITDNNHCNQSHKGHQPEADRVIVAKLATEPSILNIVQLSQIEVLKTPDNLKATVAKYTVAALAQSNIDAAVYLADWCIDNAPVYQKIEFTKATVGALAIADIDYAADHARWCIQNAADTQRDELSMYTIAELAMVHMPQAVNHAHWCVRQEWKLHRITIKSILGRLHNPRKQLKTSLLAIARNRESCDFHAKL